MGSLQIRGGCDAPRIRVNEATAPALQGPSDPHTDHENYNTMGGESDIISGQSFGEHLFEQ